MYTFYLTIGSSVTQVYPLNFLSSLLVDTQNKGEAFYRRVFTGNLIFTNNNGGDDFDLLYGVEALGLCQELIFSIERNGDPYWDGYFSTSDGKFDLDNCTFEVNPFPNDDYVLILEGADLQYNILDATTTVTTRAVSGLTDITYTRNRWLIDVIEMLADNVLTGVTVSSTFFNQTPNNPVTLAANHLLYLTIAQKSDIIRPTSTDQASSAMLSWNELTDILWTMFQVQWDYDSATNTINVEHISWWTRAAGLDLRTQLITQATNKYQYIKEEMPKYERFSFMEADNYNFVGQPIWYDSKCVNNDPEGNTIENSVKVTTDLEYIISNSEAIEDEGFVILCNYESGGLYYVEQEPGRIGDYIKLNMHLSVANLQHRYFRHNRVLIEGYMNYILTTFWTAQKTKLQECYAVVCPVDSYDPADEITTELGETYFASAKASVKRSELNPNGEMKFSLIYGPAANAVTEIADEKWALIYEDAAICGKFYILMSQSFTGNLNITLEWTIRDSAGNPVCTTFGSPETWTVPLGNTTDNHTFTVVACNPNADIPAGGCIVYFWNWPEFTAEDYIVSVKSKCEC